MGVNPLRAERRTIWSSLSRHVGCLFAGAAGDRREEARAMEVQVRRGIYAALAGPSYETPAEIHML